ncbi:MAG: NUDIX domain-containing protein [Nodosilinea sp.]
MRSPLIKVTLAVLYQEGKFLMQLRDDFPHIVYPGIWGFFGGHIEPGENADIGVHRELIEELGYAPPKLALFLQQSDDKTRRYFYHGELTVPLNELQLNEGQDLGLCSIEEIRAGEKYSERLGEVRSLGKPHQQALLTFIESGLIER